MGYDLFVEQRESCSTDRSPRHEQPVDETCRRCAADTGQEPLRQGPCGTVLHKAYQPGPVFLCRRPEHERGRRCQPGRARPVRS